MNYIKNYTDEGKVTNHFIVCKRKITDLDSFKKVIFEAISNHPLTNDKIDFKETYKIVSKINKEQDWYDIEVKGITFNVFWG